MAFSGWSALAALGCGTPTGAGGTAEEREAAEVARRFFDAVRQNRSDVAAALLAPSAAATQTPAVQRTAGQMSKREIRDVTAEARGAESRFDAKVRYRYRESFRGPNESWQDGVMRLAVLRESGRLAVVDFDAL